MWIGVRTACSGDVVGTVFSVYNNLFGSGTLVQDTELYALGKTHY
jgi:hypothetical protein